MKLWDHNADTKPELNTPGAANRKASRMTEYGAQEPPLSETLKDPPQYAKAIVGGVVAGLSSAGLAAQDGFTVQEWIGIALATVTGFATVFWVKNKEV
jgi:surface antigen